MIPKLLSTDEVMRRLAADAGAFVVRVTLWWISGTSRDARQGILAGIDLPRIQAPGVLGLLDSGTHYLVMDQEADARAFLEAFTTLKRQGGYLVENLGAMSPKGFAFPLPGND